LEQHGLPICCILGATEFHNPDSKALVEAIAQKFRGVWKVVFVTGGCSGVHQTFVQKCGEGSLVWNLMPMGESCVFDWGQDIHVGADWKERNMISGMLGDIYITVEGGPGTAQEACMAHSRGAIVVPLRRTGGASDGQHGFPACALNRPDFVTEEQWSLLADRAASVDATAAAVVDIVTSPAAAEASKRPVDQLSHSLRSEFRKRGFICCILGTTQFHHRDTEALVIAMARKLHRATRQVVYVTGGCAGVHETFTRSCRCQERVINLMPRGETSSYSEGTLVHAGADWEERNMISGMIGDIYITVEGGPGTAQEASAAHARGAVVVPLRRTGGASGGKFGFPAGALTRPEFVTEEQWAALGDQVAPVDATATSLAEIVKRCIEVSGSHGSS